jgi:Methyltransferase domain
MPGGRGVQDSPPARAGIWTGARSLIRRVAEGYSRRQRERRDAVFRARLRPTPADRILDLGSEDGAHIASVLGPGYTVFLADIDPQALQRGSGAYGFTPLLISENAVLPFADAEFDIVFCSSVIEHATVDKADLLDYQSGLEFKRAARARQQQLADEIRRIGRRYYVQTPYRYFPLESHTWLPFIFLLLPRRLQIRLINRVNRVWPKKTLPDFYLLNRREMRQLFPDADIVYERSFGLVKSLIAVRT